VPWPGRERMDASPPTSRTRSWMDERTPVREPTDSGSKPTPSSSTSTTTVSPSRRTLTRATDTFAWRSTFRSASSVASSRADSTSGGTDTASSVLNSTASPNSAIPFAIRSVNVSPPAGTAGRAWSSRSRRVAAATALTGLTSRRSMAIRRRVWSTSSCTKRPTSCAERCVASASAMRRFSRTAAAWASSVSAAAPSRVSMITNMTPAVKARRPSSPASCRTRPIPASAGASSTARIPAWKTPTAPRRAARHRDRLATTTNIRVAVR